MPEFPNHNPVSIRRLILVPGLITLGITLLRLAGELQNWSPRFFSRSPGGGGSLVGISWLVPLFGIYFAVKLVKEGERPQSTMKAILFTVLGIILFFAFAATAVALKLAFVWIIVLSATGSIAAIVVCWRGWPLLSETLFKYGLFARIPVLIVMFFAIRGNWGTHYDSPSPQVPAMGVWAEFFWTGVIPQLTFWLAYTVLVGALFGAVAGALAARRSKLAAAAA